MVFYSRYQSKDSILDSVGPMVYWSVCDCCSLDQISSHRALDHMHIKYLIAYKKTDPTCAHACFSDTDERISFGAARISAL